MRISSRRLGCRPPTRGRAMQIILLETDSPLQRRATMFSQGIVTAAGAHREHRLRRHHAQAYDVSTSIPMGSCGFGDAHVRARGADVARNAGHQSTRKECCLARSSKGKEGAHMRSQSHPQPARNGVKSLIDALIRAICDVSTVYALLGDLIAARTRTVKRSDYSSRMRPLQCNPFGHNDADDIGTPGFTPGVPQRPRVARLVITSAELCLRAVNSQAVRMNV